jgi:putative membrane protein
VLIFISLLERKVWILGDRGINAKMGHNAWKGLVSELTQGIKENRAADALCTVIIKLGDTLAEHFPKKDDDTNELPDKVIA